jgi:hypothetical protein
MASRRGDIDDRATAPIDHAVDDRLAHQHRPDEVAIQKRPNIFELHVKRVVRVGLSARRCDIAAGGVHENRHGPQG